MRAQAITCNADINKLALGAPRQNVGRGVYLQPAETEGTSHRWRFDYTFKNQRKTLSLGVYPDVTFEVATDTAAAMRQQLQKGLDPSKLRQAEKARGKVTGALQNLSLPDRFEQVALRWLDTMEPSWTSNYADKVKARFRNHVFPFIGHRAIGQLDSADILAVCRKAQSTGGADTGRRVCQMCSSVFCLAVVEGLASQDFYKAVRKQLKKSGGGHFAAITDPEELAELLKSIDNYPGTFVVRCALRLAPLVMSRPGEMRQARWKEFDLDNGLWLIPSQRMKRTLEEKENGEPHLVPLSKQAVEILESLFLLTGRTGWVFPNARSDMKCMSSGAINSALQAMGYCTETEMTAHGFRATARTILVERLKWSSEYAEMQLAHAVPDLNGKAYNRAEYEEDRKRMMQDWADYLDGLRRGETSVGDTWRDQFTPVTGRLNS